MPLQTRICEILEIEYPIFLAGMGGASVPALAAAVSNAGGLGVLGAAACSPDQLRSWIRQTREMTDKPFGVNITFLPSLTPPDYPAIVKAVIEGGVKAVGARRAARAEEAAVRG